MSCLQGDAQAADYYYKMAHCVLLIPRGQYDAAQRLGCDFHRTMVGLSFNCGLPSGRKDFTRHRLVLRKHWQSSKRRRIGLGRKLARSCLSEAIERRALHGTLICALDVEEGIVL
jgi:hypothetical protein